MQNRRRGGENANMYGSDPEEEDQVELLAKQLEMDVLRLMQRVSNLERA
jgi:hypothetical protein